MKTVTALFLIVIGGMTASPADQLSKFGGFIGNASRELDIAQVYTGPFRYSYDQIEAPLRRVEGKTCDLRPLFSWIRKPVDLRGDCPMSSWRGFEDMTVDQTLNEGVLVKHIRKFRPAGEMFDREDITGPYLLKNYPRRVSDGTKISFVAIRTGNISLRGSTIESLDYGQPLDPAQTAEYLQTNAPAKIANLRNRAISTNSPQKLKLTLAP